MWFEWEQPFLGNSAGRLELESGYNTKPPVDMLIFFSKGTSIFVSCRDLLSMGHETGQDCVTDGKAFSSLQNNTVISFDNWR